MVSGKWADKGRGSALVALFVLMAGAAQSALAADEAGYVKTIKGQVHLERGGGSHIVQLGETIFESDRIRVAADSSIGISFKDETLISLGAGSNFWVTRYSYDPTTRAGEVDTMLAKGTMRFVTGLIGKTNPQAIKVNTPTATMGVRGTDFIVEVPDGK